MLRAIKQNLKPFLITSALAGSGGFGYLYYTVSKNHYEHEERIKNENQLKDNTRPQYEFFGISWGYRADAIVQDKLDTGDFLFMKFECQECVTIRDIVRCYYNNFMSPFPHFDSFGVIYRDNLGVHVIYDRFGVLRACNYVECLCEPFWNHLSTRKLIIKDPELASKTQKIISDLFEEIKGQNSEVKSDQLLQEVLARLSLVKKNYRSQLDEISIEDLDKSHPPFFDEGIALSDSIIIRNQTNRVTEG